MATKKRKRVQIQIDKDLADATGAVLNEAKKADFLFSKAIEKTPVKM